MKQMDLCMKIFVYVNRFYLLLFLRILALQATLKFEYNNSSCICIYC